MVIRIVSIIAQTGKRLLDGWGPILIVRFAGTVKGSRDSLTRYIDF
jgi:hypothetical protein